MSNERELFLFYCSAFPGAAILGASDVDSEEHDRPIIDEFGWATFHYPLQARLMENPSDTVNANGQKQVAVMLNLHPVTALMPGDPIKVKLEVFLGRVQNQALLNAYKQRVKMLRAEASGLVLP